MRANTKLIAILAAVVVALVGCGDDNSADQRTPTAQVEELCKAVEPYKGKDGDKPYPEVIAPILRHAHDQYAHLAEALAKLDDGSLSGLVEQVKAVEPRLEVAARAARQGDMEALADAAPEAQKSLDQLSAEFRRAGFNDCIVLGTLP
jgi:hypothetical protein